MDSAELQTGPGPLTGRPKRRLQIALPALYVAFAVYAWIDFTKTNHDGLANLGLFVVTAPVTIAGFLVDAVTGRSNVLMPHGHGYLGDHALYYVPAVAVTAGVWWLIGRGCDRMWSGEPPL